MREHHPHNRPSAKKNSGKVAKIIGAVIGGVFLAAGFALLFGWIVMLLWNWLMPVIFGLITITYWQAFGLVFLARLLFGGGHKGGDNHDHGDKCGNITEEKIERFFEENFCKDKKKDNDFQDFWDKEGKEAFENFKIRKAAEDVTSSDTE